MMEREFVCKFCNKKFPSGKSLGGHIRIHTNEYSLGFNGKNPKKRNKLVDQRDVTALKQQQQQQLCCGSNHMDCHCVGEKMVVDSQSDTETTSSAPTKKRSKKQSSSESFSSSSASEIDQEHKKTAWSLMMMSIDSKGHNLVLNSLVAESSENNSEVLETKASPGEQLKTDNVAVDDQLDDENGASDTYSSDSDYFMNGPKKSDSDISVDGSLSNTGLNRFKEVGYELRKSKRVLPSYESDSCADTNSKIHRSSYNKSPMVGAKKKSKGHECPICFRVFKSGQALGGHKRSHSIENQRINHKAAAAYMQIDLNLPAQDC